ncbi:MULTISPECIES: SMP-30/gluconolactonase/LRE family protein [unclassified Meridianimarinicoccus]|uniref:SMP-30/gluconolactonase/LRE family protein n=1 Tax=unclassified Meridianimarinicoccus TaxID=2923344 RepID=UPI001865A3EE|nr:SMP-30/gluconolactonase/LRE family protein [Fluviibacterium sp. MJW13]
MSAPLQARLLVDCKAGLGEGVQWHRQTRRVYWTDIDGNILWSATETGESVRQVALDAPLCDFAFTPDGNMLAGFADALCWLDPRTGVRRVIETYMSGNPDTRMNNGALDRQGRFIIGGIHTAGLEPVTPVWSISRGRVRPILTEVGCASATAFSPDGTRMYFADSRGPDILAYDYDTVTGMPRDARIFATLEPDEGAPDGACVDAEGALWTACFGGGVVQRWLPDGRRDLTVRLPVPNVTCCALGGMKMQRLFITTARSGMNPDDLDKTPEAGGLFAVDVPVKGLPVGTYRR